MPSDLNSIEEAITALKEKNAELNAKLIESQAAQNELKAKQKAAHGAKTAELKATIAGLTASNKEAKKQLSKIEATKTEELINIRIQIEALTKSIECLESEEKTLKQKPAEPDPHTQIESLRKQKTNREAELALQKAQLSSRQAQRTKATQAREAKLLQASKKEQIKKEKTEKIESLKQTVQTLKLENIQLNTALIPLARSSVQLQLKREGLQFSKQFQNEKFRRDEEAFKRLLPPNPPFYPVYAPPPVIIRLPYPYQTPPMAYPMQRNPVLNPYYRYP
jgi:hypothetical protein